MHHCYPTLDRTILQVVNDAVTRQLGARSYPLAQLRTLRVLHDGAWEHDPLEYL